jgi:hypothetical protein
VTLVRQPGVSLVRVLTRVEQPGKVQPMNEERITPGWCLKLSRNTFAKFVIAPVILIGLIMVLTLLHNLHAF